MTSTRREFIRTGTLGAAVVFSRAPALLGASADARRKKLAHRRRRIIFNDDGDDVWNPQAKTPDGFVNVRLKHMLDTQVDTLFYCTTQSFNYFTHHTKVGEVFLSREGAFGHNNMQALIDAGTDPLKLAMAYAHKHGIEAVWTLRMNDIHDAFTPPLFPQWKRDHPDALLGKKENLAKYPASGQRHWWAGVDFNRADVRKRTVELIDEVARNYDVDAIDLDWLRHPIHFPETLLGKPVTRKQIDLITGLVRDVRKIVGQAGDKRGRPILLSARVPMTIEHGLYMGTDVETWLKAGLIDVLTIGGGYVPFSMPSHEIVALGHRHGVPVYPCISCSGMLRRKPYGPGSPYAASGWLAAAANAFGAGAGGVSLFNLFPAPGNDPQNQLVRQVFSQVGEPPTLLGKDKLFCLDNAAHLTNCGYINHVVPYKGCLPKTIEPGKALSVTLPVGEDVGRAKSTTLRIQTDKPSDPRCRLNGESIATKPSTDLTKRFGMSWRVAEIKPAAVKKGGNTFEAVLGKPGDKPIALTGLELSVRYS